MLMLYDCARRHRYPTKQAILLLYLRPDGKAGELAVFYDCGITFDAPLCKLQTHNDEPRMTEKKGQVSIQCTSAHTGHAAHYKPAEHRDKKGNRHNAVKEFDRKANLNWREELKVPKEQSANSQTLVGMLAHFENMWDGHFGSIKEIQHQIEP